MKERTPQSRTRRLLRSIVRIVAIFTILSLILHITGCMESMFYFPQKEPTPARLGPPGTIEVPFESADGTRLFGWLIPAKGDRKRMNEAPTVLHVHGNAGSILSHAFFTEHLPFAGFNVFIFDYRGYGQSEGRASRRGPLIEDTHAALDAILARDDVDPSRIGVYGQSLGGSIALNVMAGRPEIRAAVIESAFTSWRDVAADSLGRGSSNALTRTLAAIFIPDEYRADEAIARINRPMLILHGDGDTIIPVAHGRALAAAAPNHAQLVELPGGEHNSLRMSHAMIDQVMIDFFNEHLQGRSETEDER